MQPGQERTRARTESSYERGQIGGNITTCRLNDVNSGVYLAETLDTLINGHPQSRIEELMPWRIQKLSSQNPKSIGKAPTHVPH
ncbi:transposase domain-containing protein [Labrys portucalensis]|uniref:Transposase domain-containing protein n=1 Tax=Labrys neptuniae TaxID=376174 RepID=A0ABV6ZN29_9HYPH